MLYIYLCAFKSYTYLKEACVCIQSIRNYHYYGKIYLFTDLDVDKIDHLGNVEVIQVPCENIQLSAAYRLKIFDNLPLDQFNKEEDILLYLDTDILLVNKLPSFQYINHQIHTYGYPSRKQQEPSFCGLLTKDPFFTQKESTCTGILLFRPSEKVKEVFDEAYNYYVKLVSENKVSSCWEQPTLCYYLIFFEMHNNSLNDIVHEQRTNKPIPNNAVFNHFCGLRGSNRFNQMKNSLQQKNDMNN